MNEQGNYFHLKVLSRIRVYPMFNPGKSVAKPEYFLKRKGQANKS